MEVAAARRINGQGVADLLEAVCRFRGYPAAIRTDQGPEFTGRALDQWAQANGVKLVLIQPGKPTQNAYIESFNGKFRDACLNENWLTSLEHARTVISTWRRDYNQVRPPARSAISRQRLSRQRSGTKDSQNPPRAISSPTRTLRSSHWP